MTRYVALLRGINVGGNKLVRMAELREAVAAAGMADVQTLLQSGNVVFKSKDHPRADVELTVKRVVAGACRVECDVFVRTAAELDRIVEQNPFRAEAESDPAKLVVVFLNAQPEKGAVEAIGAAIAGPERLESGPECLFAFFPDGQGNSTVAKTPGWTKLVGAGTARNWNTVRKLADMARNEIAPSCRRGCRPS